MTTCLILNACKTFPNEIAIYSDEGTFTYKELNELIDENDRIDQIFYADLTISTIVHIFSLLRKGKVALPISLREPFLPQIDLSQIPRGVNTLISTSGTMAKPKLAMHSLEQHIFSALHPHPDFALKQPDSYLLSLPLNHIGGLAILFRVFSAGASLILGEVNKHRATHISFVPTQLKRFLALKQSLSFPHLKGILLGGAPIPKKLCDEAYDHNIPLLITYGMTETSSQFATAPYKKEEGVHVGKPLEGRELKIDEHSVLWVKGKTLFQGYFGPTSPFKDGWFRTGDLGRVGKYGLEILGRHDRVIISGGENISLDELETEFLSIAQVSDVTLSQRPCDEFGTRPVVHLSLTAPLEVETIIDLLERRLPRFKIPKSSDIHILI